MAIPGIHEIQTLATKYSKTQLQKMAQMGLIDTTKAVMAGMMIDRISKQNMAPPATTVAEDALAPPAPQGPPQGAPQEPPQMGPDGAPPQANAGVAALPSNIPEMAGGGIVAFADGGGVDGYAGGGPIAFADRGYVDSDLFRSVIAAESRGNPNAVSPKGARGLAQLMPGTARDPGYGVKGVRDESHEENRRVGNDYLNAMIDKYGNIDYALAAYNWGPGNVDKWIANGADPKKLPKETRDYIPKVKAGMAQIQEKSPVPGRELLSKAADLLPSAQAAEVKTKNPISATKNTDTGDYYQDPLGAPDYSAEGFNFKQRIEPGKLYEPSLQGQIFGYERGPLPAIATPKKDAVPPAVPPGQETLQPRTEAAPPVEQVVPRERRERGAPDDLGKIEAEQITVPGTTSLQAERERREEAFAEAGVDTNMYKDMMAEVASRKDGGAKKREQALGMALMMTGLGLAGARRGQEFQALSGAGRQALQQFQGTMDSIVANEDKLDNMVRELKMAENNYKRTGAESDLTRVRAREEKIEAINIKNMELKNAAKLESAKLAVTKFGYSRPAPVVEAVNEILKDMPPGTPFIKGLEAYNLSQNISKPQNRLSYEEAAKIVGADVTIMPKDKPAAIEAMLREAARLQGGGGGGGGGSLAPGKDGTFNYVPGGTK